MAYTFDSSNFKNIQLGVLTEKTSSNELIPASKALSTSKKFIIGAINELYARLVEVETQSNNVNASMETLNAAVTALSENGGSNSGTNSEAVGSVNINRDDFINVAEGQTAFVLSKTPVDPENILFYVNGILYNKSATQYNSETNTVTWLGFNVDTVDIISIIYNV